MSKFFNLFKAISAAQNSKDLFHLIYFITARCNARCKFCFYLDNIEQANENLKNELKINEIEKTFKKIGYIPYVSLSGGEPFLRKDLADILEIIMKYSKPLMISIPTNGAYTDRIKNVLETTLKKKFPTEINIQLSIDAKEKEHDEIRQVPGLFKKMIETNKVISAMSKVYRNLATKIVITYSTFNAAFVDDLIDFANKNFYFDRLILSKVHGNAEGKKGLDYNHYRTLLKKVNQINKNNIKNQSIITRASLLVKNKKEKIRNFFDENKNLGRYCNASKKILVLSEYGDLYPCEVLSNKLGNIKNHDYDINKILIEESNKFIKDNKIKEQCHCDWGCAQNVALVSNKNLWFRS